MKALKRLRLELGNFARFNPTCRYVTSHILTIKEMLRSIRTATDCALSAAELARAARICPSPRKLRRLEANLRRRIARIDPAGLDWDRVFPYSQPREIRKGIILKKPLAAGEKGVLLIAFEDHWLRLLRYADINKLAGDYRLVLGPTWSPPHDLPFMLAAKMWPGTLCHLISSLEDIPAFARLADNLVTVPLLSSNWVNPDLFDTSEPVPKEFDMVMLANFATYKRHFLLFRALREMPATTRVLLLGKPLEGRGEDTILAEADLYGVSDRITIRRGLPDTEMVRAMRSAKVSIILSGNEGACVAVVEAMFADIPVGLMADAIVGSRGFVNDQTGCLFKPHHLGQQLSSFIDSFDRYSPRRWVMDNNISYNGSTRLLNDRLYQAALADGEPWTQDICAHQWRPSPTYVTTDDADRMQAACRAFELNYGIPLIPNLPT
ncbi:MAG: glycosyltransferase [bacterium]